MVFNVDPSPVPSEIWSILSSYCKARLGEKIQHNYCNILQDVFLPSIGISFSVKGHFKAILAHIKRSQTPADDEVKV